jgi:hypothetical protein
MDSALRALVTAVEAGRPGPPLRILVAGGAFLGTVIPLAQFLDAMEHAASEEAAGGGRRRGLRRGGGDQGDHAAQARELLEPIRSAAHDVDAVSLGRAKWWSYDNRTTLEMPAVRVPFTAISAWWIAGEAGGEEATWYVGGGVSFPLGSA